MSAVRKRCFLVAAFTLLNTAGHAAAQVETIDPNPLMPRDPAGSLARRSHYWSGGGTLGRDLNSLRNGKREVNPAETLLKSIEGTNYGHYSGHSLFAPGAVSPMPGYARTLEGMRRTANVPSRDVRRMKSYPQQSQGGNRGARPRNGLPSPPTNRRSM